MKTKAFLLVLLALALPASAAWTYHDNDGSGTYSGTVGKYAGQNDKPYHGYITDGNVSIWVYQHDTAGHKWTIGCGQWGTGVGSIQAGTAGGPVNGTAVTYYAGDIDLSDANAAIAAATGQSDASFTVIGKRCFLNYPKESRFSITGVPPTLELVDERAFNAAHGLVNADFRGSVLATIGYYAFETQGNAPEQQFWFPDTLTTLDHRCLAYGPSKRTIHFLGDVPGFTSQAAGDSVGAIYPGANSKQWAYCVNALKYPKWATQKADDFNTAHKSWIPSAVRYVNEGDAYAVDETTGAVTWPKPFGTTLFGTTGTETYLIQEGFAGESEVPVYSTSAPAVSATTAAFGVTLSTLPNGSSWADLTLEVASDAAFSDVVAQKTIRLAASGATGTADVAGLLPGAFYYARLSGVDDQGNEGEVGDAIVFRMRLGRNGGRWTSDAQSAAPARNPADRVYFLYSSDGAWKIPIRVHAGVWQIGNNAGNENETVFDATKGDGSLDMSDVDADTGIVLTQVNGATFYGRGLTDAVLPDTLQNLGVQMFALCGSLTNAVVPSSVSSLENRAFRQCRKLARVDIARATALAEIPAGVFLDCNALQSVDLRGTAVSAIGAQAFQNCTSLSEIWLPDALASVTTNAFSWGPAVRAFHFRSAPPAIPEGAAPFYPGNTTARWVYCADATAFSGWDALLDATTPYDAETMSASIPAALASLPVRGTTPFGTSGANAILLQERVKGSASMIWLF